LCCCLLFFMRPHYSSTSFAGAFFFGLCTIPGSAGSCSSSIKAHLKFMRPNKNKMKMLRSPHSSLSLISLCCVFVWGEKLLFVFVSPSLALGGFHFLFFSFFNFKFVGSLSVPWKTSSLLHHLSSRRKKQLKQDQSKKLYIKLIN